jgi:dTDP-4-dehydrorhamnose reductase
MKKIFITGADGQLGGELKKTAPSFHSFTFEYVDVDNLDLTDKEAVGRHFVRNRYDYVIHCAAYTAVDKAETEPEKVFRMNKEVPAMLQEICAEQKSQLIHISTDYVFDGRSCVPYVETDSTNPQAVYAKSKLAGELEVLKNNDAIVVRTSWLYAAKGINFLNTMLRLGQERESLNVVFDQVGTPTSASDLAHALLTICQHMESTGKKAGGIYHYSNEGVCSWYDFAVEIMELAGLKCRIIPITSGQYSSPVKRPAYSVLDKSKIKASFGLEIPHWKSSLKKVIQSILKET